MLFQDIGRRKVVADFSGGRLSSDGGVLLLSQLDEGMGIIRSVARAFRDERNPELVEHSLEELLRQRVFGLALGYEDLNDHAELRRDPLIAMAVGKEDFLGEERRQEKDRGFAMASAATLNRLELGAKFADRYRKIHPDHKKMESAVLEMGVRALPKESELVILDFDATDDPLHGSQEGRFFHGYYGNYCYLPLYCFCGAVPLWSQLRMSDRDASQGTVEALKQIVEALRKRMPGVIIVVRADSGFAREEIMAWCESEKEVYYLIGMSRNSRLEDIIEPAMMRARLRHCLVGGTACREFMEVDYRTQQSWSRSRRMLCKAEVIVGNKTNPRFVVTNIPAHGIMSRSGRVLIEGVADSLYEQGYCGRGDAENMIKQMTLDLHADRTSTHWMASNQMRLWFSTLAYLLLERLRTLGLSGTAWKNATLGTLRLRMLKVAASVEVSVRRVHVALCSAFPLKEVFRQASSRLAQCGMEDG
jgi:hypothetical protein